MFLSKASNSQRVAVKSGSTVRSKRSSAAKRPLCVESLEERLLLDGTGGASSEDAAIDKLIARNEKLAKLQPLGDAGEGACKVLKEAGQEAAESLPGVGPVVKVCRKIVEVFDWLFESATPPETNMAAPVQGVEGETKDEFYKHTVGPEQLANDTLAEQAQLTDTVLCSDTILERMPSMLLDGPPETIPIEIVALSLRSAEPIIVNVPDGSTSNLIARAAGHDDPFIFDVGGSLCLGSTHDNGGTFQSTLPVSAKLTFASITADYRY